MNRRQRSRTLVRTLVALTALTALLAFSAAAVARPQTITAAAPCGGVAKGAPWHYKGQNGTGLKYLPKWTHDRATFDLKPVPAGWHCSAIGDYSALAKLGQCTTPKGGIFEWLPKQKK
jgi:hypothetical protein